MVKQKSHGFARPWLTLKNVILLYEPRTGGCWINWKAHYFNFI